MFHETQYVMFTGILSVRYRIGLYRSKKLAHRPKINTYELISIHFDEPSSSEQLRFFQKQFNLSLLTIFFVKRRKYKMKDENYMEKILYIHIHRVKEPSSIRV